MENKNKKPHPPVGGVDLERTNILVIGRHAEILETVLRLINNNPAWRAIGAVSNADAISLFNTTDFRLVLLCNGIGPAEEDELRRAFISRNPQIIIVQHYGGGSGLLAAEIYQALGV